MMQTYLAVMFGGAMGSALRFWLASSISARYGESFPTGTLVVNVAGCLIIGVFAGLAGTTAQPGDSILLRQFIVPGFLGGFTTFSAFGLQTFVLASGGDLRRAAVYVLLSVILCLAAVWAGHSAARLFFH